MGRIIYGYMNKREIREDRKILFDYLLVFENINFFKFYLIIFLKVK